MNERYKNRVIALTAMLIGLFFALRSLKALFPLYFPFPFSLTPPYPLPCSEDAAHDRRAYAHDTASRRKSVGGQDDKRSTPVRDAAI